MPSTSTATASALTGPGMIEQISAIASFILRPDLAIRDGLVVTPSIMPEAAAARSSFVSAESMNSCMKGAPGGLSVFVADSRQKQATGWRRRLQGGNRLGIAARTLSNYRLGGGTDSQGSGVSQKKPFRGFGLGIMRRLRGKPF